MSRRQVVGIGVASGILWVLSPSAADRATLALAALIEPDSKS